ncbi:G-D-S-L family lipolytic protein [Maribellus sp. CM-23]|uniref:GDSL-type esterase/lipase family protein n=1 Tax=Maribellus sp. CM-23 TaxID=2781026 RepID=UPI001F43550D|nr:GDSL-type esterase/lipase family protein [Maribellus sp. CM-23]MCE4567034.1 G-D-S-L family lipolytic protein [Maribellus sp. CM-23]
MKQCVSIRLFLLVIILLGAFNIKAQDPTRFNEKINELANAEYNFSSDKRLVVFAGSSSILMWKDVQSYFPEYNVINNGFGGSHFSDLLYFYDRVILAQKPDILFIYEGDNDIANHKKPSEIFKQAKDLLKGIQQELPKTKVVFISTKPSFARSELKNEYCKFNKKLRNFCDKKENVEFADVWSIMHDEEGKLYSHIFTSDGLHMNKEGYDLWAKVLSGFLE